MNVLNSGHMSTALPFPECGCVFPTDRRIRSPLVAHLNVMQRGSVSALSELSTQRLFVLLIFAMKTSLLSTLQHRAPLLSGSGTSNTSQPWPPDSTSPSDSATAGASGAYPPSGKHLSRDHHEYNAKNAPSSMRL